MDSDKYKKQFIEFLKTVFPGELPDDVNAINLSNGNNDKQYKFVFDPDDFNGKNKDEFRARLTTSDMVFLKEARVGIED